MPKEKLNSADKTELLILVQRLWLLNSHWSFTQLIGELIELEPLDPADDKAYNEALRTLVKHYKRHHTKGLQSHTGTASVSNGPLNGLSTLQGAKLNPQQLSEQIQEHVTQTESLKQAFQTYRQQNQGQQFAEQQIPQMEQECDSEIQKLQGWQRELSNIS